MGESNAVDIYLNFIANVQDLDSDLNELSRHISKVLSKKDTGMFTKSIQEVRDLSKEVLKLASSSETFGEDMKKNSTEIYNISDKLLSLYHNLSQNPLLSMDKSIKSTAKTIREFGLTLDKLGKPAKATGDITQSVDKFNQTVSRSRAETILAGRSLEEYRQELIEAGIEVPKAFDYKDVVKYNEQLQQIIGNWERYLNSGKQEKWSDDVVEKRTELLNESLAITEQIIAADTDVAHSQENINELDRVNEDLNRRKLAIHYQLLEVQKQIAAAESSRLTTGEPQDRVDWKMLKEQEAVLKNQEKMYDRQIKQNGILRKSMEDSLRTEQEQTEETEKQTDAEKQRKEEIQKAIRAEQENMKQAKLTTSQYYYRLRSMKMVNRYLQMANNAMNNFGKKAMSAFGKAGKAVNNFTKKFKLFHINIKKANKDLNSHVNIVKRANRAHNDWGKTLKGGLTTLLKYTLGVRSLYVLFNRLRGAMSDGMQVMATQYSSVNNTMSSIVTSLNQMKNALATAIQPLTLLLAPMLEHLANTLSKVTMKIASFFAAFTGQKVVYKAIRVNKEYIESLKKQKKAMKELNQEQLAHYDMLNIIDQKKEDEEEEDLSDIIGFEEIPIEPAMIDWIQKLKELLKQLLQPIIDAWNKWKDAIKEALRKLWEAIKKLVKDILRDLLKVWKEFGQAIFEKIFSIIKNLIDFIRIIIEKIDEAWNHARNGYRILRAIAKIILRILNTVDRMTKYLVEWAKQLTLIPLFSALAEALEEVEQNIQNILDLTFTLWQGLLEIAKYLLERFAPQILDLWSDLFVIANNIAGALNNILSNGDDIFDENDMLYRMLQDIEEIVDIILAGIKECLEATKEWSANLEKPLFVLFSRIEQVIRNLIKPAIKEIVDLLVYLYKELLTLAYWMIGKLAPVLVETFGWLVGAIGNIAKGIKEALQEGERGNDIIWNIISLFNIIIDKVREFAQYTYEWADQLDFVPYFESLKTLLRELQSPLEAVMDIIGTIYTEVVLKFIKYLIEEGLPKLNDMISKFINKVDWDHLTEKVKEFLSAFEKFLEKAWETLIIILGDLGDAFAKFVNSKSFDNIIDTLVKWMNKADPNKMAKGIEKLVAGFIKLKVALSFLTYLGAFKEFVMTMINWHNNTKMVKSIAKSTKSIEAMRKMLDESGINTSKGLGKATKSILEEGDAAETATAKKKLFAEANETVAQSGENAAGGLGKAATAMGNEGKAAGGALSSIGAIALKIGGLVGIIGGSTLATVEFIDMWNNGWDILKEVLKDLGIAIAAVGAVALGVVTGPVAAAIAGVVAAVSTAAILIHDNWDDIKKWAADTWDNIKIGASTLRDNLAQTWSEIKTGVATWWSGIVTDINNWWDTLKTNASEKYGNVRQAIIDKWTEIDDDVTTWWTNIKQNLSNWWSNLTDSARESFEDVRTVIVDKWNEVKSNAEEWWGNIRESIADKWSEIVVNARDKFEEVRSNIEAKWSEAKDNAENWWTDISGSLADFWNNLISDAQDKFEEVRSNIEDKWREAKDNAEDWWNDITGALQDWWGGILEDARNAFEDIRSSIEDKWNEVRHNAEDKWNEIYDTINGKIDEFWDFVGRMKDLGSDVINGFVDGIKGAWDAAGDFFGGICEDIAGGVRDFFGIHSPSRLFKYYGNMLVEGLVEGVEEDADDTDDAMAELMPGLEVFDRMYDTIISKLTDLRQDALSLTDSLVDSMIASFAKLENLDVLNNMSTQLNKLNSIKLPDIVTGGVVSPQIELNVNADTSKLEHLLEQVLDKMDSLPEADSSNNAPIVLQLDKSTIAEAVWDEQQKRYRQLGRTPVFS